MSLISKILTSEAAKFVGFHALRGVVRATGHSVRIAAPKPRNMQCVKLGVEHKPLVQIVTFWCNLRINKLKQMGFTEEGIQRVVRNDATFLTVLGSAIASAADKGNDYDAWLFFNEDVKSTDMFELQYCDKITRVTKTTYLLRAEG